MGDTPQSSTVLVSFLLFECCNYLLEEDFHLDEAPHFQLTPVEPRRQYREYFRDDFSRVHRVRPLTANETLHRKPRCLSGT
ncbi:hypothetical protein EYF80_022670 [Liparis tanakae]|uniref:Uncharacterized protein n=1 Tax=Liparis tanakae TaxID=230148 RepID=A0A4Z2HNG1_9TELE|nr:hypothetical protein EYF80_022670 [Liparis tanakae]